MQISAALLPWKLAQTRLAGGGRHARAARERPLFAC